MQSHILWFPIKKSKHTKILTHVKALKKYYNRNVLDFPVVRASFNILWQFETRGKQPKFYPPSRDHVLVTSILNTTTFFYPG